MEVRQQPQGSEAWTSQSNTTFGNAGAQTREEELVSSVETYLD